MSAPAPASAIQGTATERQGSGHGEHHELAGPSPAIGISEPLGSTSVLALSSDIHAGIVGGLLGAAAVLIGVLGTEWAIRIRQRRASAVEAAAELALLLPHVILPISRMWMSERPDTGYGSEWARRRDQVTRLGLRIEREARWPMRRARAIRRSANDTLARVLALTNLWHGSGSEVTPDEYKALLDGQPSHPAISRLRRELLQQAETYKAQFRQQRALVSSRSPSDSA